MENIIEKPITKEQELIDYIYKKKTYIFEYYSIYDLLSLIRYAKNDKNKIIYLLDLLTIYQISIQINFNFRK